MEIRAEHQAAPVSEPVAAKVAIMRPVLVSVLQSLGTDVISALGYAEENRQRGSLPLKALGLLRQEGDGDVGIAFEYAIHDALVRERPAVVERVTDALKICRISRGKPESIFFAVEKSGSEQFINTRTDLITDRSQVLSGTRGRPVKLKRHLAGLAAAFRRPNARPSLPNSIRGLWKADLFLGSAAPDHWVGTTVKINPSHLEGANGLRIGVIPARSGRGDNIRKDDGKNLVICPVPHDGGFMQLFYETWRIAQVLMKNNFTVPKEVDLPLPQDREVARVFIERRGFTVADVIEATETFAQPHLLTSNKIQVHEESLRRGTPPETGTMVVPHAMEC